MGEQVRRSEKKAHSSWLVALSKDHRGLMKEGEWLGRYEDEIKLEQIIDDRKK